MNTPQVKVDSLQVNVKAPQQLHVVRPHSHYKQKTNSQQQIQIIKQQVNNGENQEVKSTPHKIRHIQSIDDKGQFIDQHHHSRVSENDQVRETINRSIHPEPELPLDDVELQKIVQEGAGQQGNQKTLKHFSTEQIQDKDQFNLRNSRQKKQKKRRLSQSNIQNYIEVNNHFPVAEYLNEQNKTVPQKIIEEQAQFEKKQKQCLSPATRDRRKSVHSIRRHGSTNSVSEQIQRMIVDQMDKKKKVKNQQQIEQQKEQRMQEITQQKQEDELINTCKLQQARQKMQSQIDNLQKGVYGQIGLQQQRHLIMQKSETIKQDDRQNNNE